MERGARFEGAERGRVTMSQGRMGKRRGGR